jgi:hypothetical protein
MCDTGCHLTAHERSFACMYIQAFKSCAYHVKARGCAVRSLPVSKESSAVISVCIVFHLFLRQRSQHPVDTTKRGEKLDECISRPCSQTSERRSREERDVCKNEKGCQRETDPAPIASPGWLRTDSYNHRFELFMVHLSLGPLRRRKNRLSGVPEMRPHPSTCQLEAV